MVAIIIGQMFPSEARKASLRRISEDLALVKRNVDLIEAYAGIERCDINKFAHAWSVDGEGSNITFVVV